jgi:CRP-like cAMP-binding protein/phosphoribosyl 1,2-cyclic phosphodiesterase
MAAVPVASTIVALPRGGTIVHTSIGPVQFGAPPETIKDSLQAGIEVPSVFVLPQTWFSRRRGITVAELEFPVYYNYFVRGRRVLAVCDESGRKRLLSVLRESLLGPAVVDIARDYASQVPAEARADLHREMDWFRKKGDERIELDDVIAFSIYDDAGRAVLGGGAVEIARAARGWRLSDGGRVVAEVDDVEPPELKDPAVRLVPATFHPPTFGLTVLGSSHGFDPGGKTTGFVLWVNKRGVLVDPPCDATETLAAAGVPPRQVDAVILTHCHADHDAGVFQKVLQEGRVSLYTTPTILSSFLRKYVALTGESEEKLRRLFVFRPVSVGGPLRILGAEFRFFYSLHAIPTIGFEVWCGGKSFAYSADTLYDPGRIEEMYQSGVLSPARRDALLHFPWHHSMVLHEAGVPPIHTPPERLADLPDDVKQRLRLIHIAESGLPEGRGLKLARTGFDQTISLKVQASGDAPALEALDALSAIELFRDLTIERGREFLTIAKREQWASGSLVIGQGEAGDRFYIIVSGEAQVVKDGAVVTTYKHGDFFGETALLTGAPRSADVRAKTQLVVLVLDKYDFLSFLRGTDLAEALVRLGRNRELPSWDLLEENAALSTLSDAQRTQLQAILEPVTVEEGAVLWTEGDPEVAWLLETALVDFVEDGETTAHLARGSFIGDVEAILKRETPKGEERRRARAVVVKSGKAFRIAAAGLAAFLEHNPRVMLSLSGSLFVD